MQRDAPQVEGEDRGKAGFAESFEQEKGEKVPVMVERVVDDTDAIVRVVRLTGWPGTTTGEREVKRALPETLLKCQLHRDVDLFDRADGYVREYY